MMFYVLVSYMVAMLDLSGGRGHEDPEGRDGGLHHLSAIIGNGYDDLNGQHSW